MQMIDDLTANVVTPAFDVPDYHAHVRRDAFHLSPRECGRILEIGMGAGGTMAALKEVRKISFSAGIEINETAAAEARKVADEVITGDATLLDFPEHWSGFDVILCLDVLEHLVDPWHMVRRLHPLLASGGVIVASLPNVNYFRVVFPLFFRGEWELRDAGVLDRTHLRFFVKKTVVDLMTCSGLELSRIEAGGVPYKSKRWLLSKMSAGFLNRFLAPQYLIKVSRPVSVNRSVRDMAR
jgi:2-polyprenyl-3-methyl-5-hydroxy-6-metoxy-1,4-benzoquinol methylase